MRLFAALRQPVASLPRRARAPRRRTAAAWRPCAPRAARGVRSVRRRRRPRPSVGAAAASPCGPAAAARRRRVLRLVGPGWRRRPAGRARPAARSSARDASASSPARPRVPVRLHVGPRRPAAYRADHDRGGSSSSRSRSRSRITLVSRASDSALAEPPDLVADRVGDLAVDQGPERREGRPQPPAGDPAWWTPSWTSAPDLAVPAAQLADLPASRRCSSPGRSAAPTPAERSGAGGPVAEHPARSCAARCSARLSARASARPRRRAGPSSPATAPAPTPARRPAASCPPACRSPGRRRARPARRRRPPADHGAVRRVAIAATGSSGAPRSRPTTIAAAARAAVASPAQRDPDLVPAVARGDLEVPALVAPPVRRRSERRPGSAPGRRCRSRPRPARRPDRGPTERPRQRRQVGQDGVGRGGAGPLDLAVDRHGTVSTRQGERRLIRSAG